MQSFLSVPTPSWRRNGMKTTVFALGLLLAAPGAHALQPLDAFIASSRSHNADALEAQANVEQQEAQAGTSLARVLPGVAVRGTYTRNQYDSILDFQGKQITIVPINQRDLLATLTVPLIDLAGFTRVAAARTAAGAATQQLAAARLQVEAQVVQGYYQLVANAALSAASQRALEVSKQSLQLAQNRYAAGEGLVLDVERAKADVELQNQQVASAALQIALATRALESTSGLTPAPGAAIPLDDDLHPEQPLASFDGEPARLPQIAAAAEARRAAEQQSDAQRLALLPTIFGSFTERGTSAPGFTGHGFTWQAVLGFNWNLDFSNASLIRTQDAAANGARARELRARLQARDAIHRQWETVSASIARDRSARAGRDAAAHAAEQAKDRYAAGAVTQLELLQAQRDLFTADVARIQADADLINARAQLRLASGATLLHDPAATPKEGKQ